jgi:hypothetical protein
MYDTLIHDVLGKIQEYKIEDDNIYVVGWCFHFHQGVLPIRLNYDNTAFEKPNGIFKIENRPDVCDVFKNDSLEKSGWSVHIKQAEIIETLKLEMKIDGEWKTIFDFLFYATTKKYIPSFVVVDDFYKNPDKIREYALKQQFNEHPDYHKGKRTDKVYRFPNLKLRFENILGSKIKNWTKYGVNCCFQSCIAGDNLVYHFDGQQYAGIIFLTPDAPPETGTSFYRSKTTKNMKLNNDFDSVFKTGLLDGTQFDVVDVVGNKYNRLVLFDAQMFHAASGYFGNSIDNGRLFQLFFFDLE